MAERFKAPVLKTDDGQPSASSNLAPTANLSGRSPLKIGGSGIRIANGGAVGPPERACAHREKGRPQPWRVGHRNLAPTANLAASDNRKSQINNPPYSLQDLEIYTLVPGVSGRTN